MRNQLPAYLQNKQSRGLAQSLAANLGAGSPPYLSIMGNRLSLIDAAGEEIPVPTYDPKIGPYLDCAIIDSLDVTSKIYYDKPFDPAANQYEPPACFSDNGVAPSRNASKPQARTCAECQWGMWGSKTSLVSGKQVKACNDIQKIVFIVPGYEMPFLLRIPPGSRTNFRGYVNKFVGQQVDLCDVTTRIYFQAGVNGILCFDAVGFIPEAMFGQCEKLLAAHATDAMIGRLDQPIQGALAAPAPAAQIEHQPAAPVSATAGGFQQPQQQPIAQPTPAAPSGGRRRRNTAEVAPQQPAQPQGAPFMQPAVQPAQPANFGITEAPAPSNEMQSTLDRLFGAKG